MRGTSLLPLNPVSTLYPVLRHPHVVAREQFVAFQNERLGVARTCRRCPARAGGHRRGARAASTEGLNWFPEEAEDGPFGAFRVRIARTRWSRSWFRGDLKSWDMITDGSARRVRQQTERLRERFLRWGLHAPLGETWSTPRGCRSL